MILSNFSVNDFDFVNYTDCTEDILLEILKYRNTFEISKWMRNTNKITQEQHYSFVDSLKTCDDKKYFAVFKEKEYVGSIYIVKNDKGNWERGLYLIPQFQGKGIAASMEFLFLDKLRSIGINKIEAEIETDNQRSIVFHKRIGYTVTSKDDKYILMSLNLT